MTNEELKTFERLADSVELVSQSFSGDMTDSVNFHALGREHIRQMTALNETLHQLKEAMYEILAEMRIKRRLNG